MSSGEGARVGTYRTTVGTVPLHRPVTPSSLRTCLTTGVIAIFLLYMSANLSLGSCHPFPSNEIQLHWGRQSCQLSTSLPIPRRPAPEDHTCESLLHNQSLNANIDAPLGPLDQLALRIYRIRLLHPRLQQIQRLERYGRDKAAQPP